MAHINLLPWREEQRAKQQKEFVTSLLGGAIVACLLVFLAHLRLSGMIGTQENRNEFLGDAIVELDTRIEMIKDLRGTKDNLLARMNIIQELQRNRPLSVHLVDELVRTLPDGVYIYEFSQKDNHLVMSGVAQSNARVSAYMRNVDTSDWLSSPKLDVIKTKKAKGQRVAEFTLRATQKATMEDLLQNFTAGDLNGISGT